ncbi:MAG TPA: esterase family protein [Clostridiales bacterium]|nr:esterase family protein [Clostridiales bacterium]
MALLHVNFFSKVLGMNMQMDVILPEQTKGQIGMEASSQSGKIPTLYLLHGMSDDHTIWQRRTSIERYVSNLNMAVVMPSTHLGWYTDMAYGNKYFTFISEELPQICRRLFNNLSDKREETFVAGLSMGGYGAFKIGLATSETFGMAASLSGALDINGIINANSKNEDSYIPEQFWKNIFGDVNQIKNSENDLLYLASKLKDSGKPLTKLYFCCGTEDFLYETNTIMKKHLEKIDYDFTYEESLGDHNWEYWDEKIKSVLKWITDSN